MLVKCPSCSRELTEGGRYCPHCAALLDATSAETAVLGAPVSSSAPLLPSSSSVDEGRFLPGTVLSGRYRIAGLLGRGGMGEVYRATDLTLGQAVALKFLPESTARDERALVRFYNEVRIARQVTHPNVCRVYDIGEVQGLRYISMEYVDGEDLGSLLRRIGRLPADKAVDAARQMCAGLTAAHEKGVLHRDLKPANIMVDGRGQIILMDFGLAGLAEQLQVDVRSGTPAYMSPEQLAGTEVTVRSDIYSLGLVLYELFTGKRAFEAASILELMEMQQRAAPASITSVARDLDPAVERVILRCLQPDPRQRPASALIVAAGLPGGDPLAAAVAAGETPSPELVAAAGETEGLRPVVAISWLAAALVGIIVIGIVGARFYITRQVPFDIPPDALAVNARNLLKTLGFPARPRDAVWGLDYNSDYQRYLDRHLDLASARWMNPAAGMPPLIVFWYRESPRPMIARLQGNTAVHWSDPPFEISGMVRLQTDSEGRLIEFAAVPPQVEPPAASPSPAFDWAILFQAAGLNPVGLQPAQPEWTPLANWDARAAWTGTDLPTHAAVRVEAAAWRGRPVFFRIIGPWTRPERMEAAGSGTPGVVLALIYLALAGSGLLVWYNLRTGRGDIRGAAKLALLYFTCMSGARLLSARHAVDMQELTLFWHIIAVGALNGAIVGAFYLAVEPWVRRRWPETLISWSRFTTKGIRDPLVGRDLLYGAGMACIWVALALAKLRLHGPVGEPVFASLDALSGVREAASAALESFTGSLFEPLFAFFVLFVARVLLRKQWLAAAALVVVFTVAASGSITYPRVDWPLNVLSAGLIAFILIRFGLLALIAAEALTNFLLGVPRTLDFSQWYAGMGIAPIILVALIAVYGFRISLGGQKLLKETSD